MVMGYGWGRVGEDRVKIGMERVKGDESIEGGLILKE